MLLTLLACSEPLWHLSPPDHRAGPGHDTVVGDTALEHGDPITHLADMDVPTVGMELTDIVQVSQDRIVLLGQHQQQDGGAWLVDISDPEAPVQVDQLSTWVLQYGCWDGTSLWGAHRTADLYRVSVTPEAIELVATHEGVVTGGTLACDGDNVAWASAERGAGVGSLDDQGNLVTDTQVSGTWYSVELVDDLLWTSGAGELASWDLSGQQLGALELPGTCRASSPREGVLALGCGSQGVVLVDISDPSSPSLLGQWAGHASVRHVAWDGDHILASAWTELALIDASDLGDPQLQATEPAYSAVMASLPDGQGRVYVSDWHHPFVVEWNDVDAPEIRLSPPGSLPGEIVQVHNDGRRALRLDEPEGGHLAAQVVQPGQRTQWTLPSETSADGLTLGSNDPDETAEITLGSSHGVPLGEEAPTFVEVDTDGVVWDLAALRGKVVWLGLFSEGCPVCATEVGETEVHMARWADEEDLVRLWAYSGDENKAQAWTASQGILVPVLLDHDSSIRSDYFVPNQTDSSTFAANPRHYLIDRDGVLVYASTTVSPADEDVVIQAALDSESGGR